MNFQLEICANSVQSAIEAQKGGATRVELCDNIYEGGTTPSYGTVAFAREVLDIKLHIIVRPRGGDFLYSDTEFEIMKRDVQMANQLKVDGIVIGILDKNGDVDKLRTSELVKLAGNMSVTFHRAFDMTPDPKKALEEVIKCGCDRVLTSGQQNKALDGKNLIKDLILQANDRISIMPGSGINADNICDLTTYCGAKEFHLSGRTAIESEMIYRKEGIYMGGLPQIPEYEQFVTDKSKVSEIVSMLNQYNLGL